MRALIEVLNRHRGKGQQKVTVEHPLSEAGLLILPSVVRMCSEWTERIAHPAHHGDDRSPGVGRRISEDQRFMSVDNPILDCAIHRPAEIAEREVQGERHIRLLVPLAFLSPRIVATIVDGTAPTDLTVTGLAKALPYSWGEQEQRFSL